MGAWIEIINICFCPFSALVAPHDGCVDWNMLSANLSYSPCVAPHDGCVDWNRNIRMDDSIFTVAPHDGCVDWNFCLNSNRSYISESHPTMGAWIEIKEEVLEASFRFRRTPRWVRGLKLCISAIYTWKPESHPTMGAWIEIFVNNNWLTFGLVAPHDGCVDWNIHITIIT